MVIPLPANRICNEMLKRRRGWTGCSRRGSRGGSVGSLPPGGATPHASAYHIIIALVPCKQYCGPGAMGLSLLLTHHLRSCHITANAREISTRFSSSSVVPLITLLIDK
jgi:hypothetical protein